jgi:hypothetical protein
VGNRDLGHSYDEARQTDTRLSQTDTMDGCMAFVVVVLGRDELNLSQATQCVVYGHVPTTTPRESCVSLPCHTLSQHTANANRGFLFSQSTSVHHTIGSRTLATLVE